MLNPLRVRVARVRCVCVYVCVRCMVCWVCARASVCLCVCVCVCACVFLPPLPPYNENATARSQLRAFSLGVSKSPVRSCVCGVGIPPCKILISPRPLTTPRRVFIIKPKRGARSCCCSSPHVVREFARELRAHILLFRIAHSARSSPRAGFDHAFCPLAWPLDCPQLWLVLTGLLATSRQIAQNHGQLDPRELRCFPSSTANVFLIVCTFVCVGG